MTIGDLTVRLGMNIGGLQAGTAKAMNTLGGLEKGLGGLRNLAMGFGGALAGMFSVGGLGLLTTQSFALIDSNAKLARSLGMSSAELAGLQHAANLSGVEMNMFGEQLMKLQAKGGSFDAIARKMDTISDPTERAAYAVSQLGEEGLQLLPIFADGSAALRQMIAEGQRAKGISPLDEKLVEEANNALTRMKAEFTGVGNVLAVTVAPYVSMFADGLRAMIPSVDELKGQFTFWGGVMKETIPVVGGLFAALMTITGAQKALATGQALLLALSGPKGWATLVAGAAIAAGAYIAIDSAMDGVVNAAQTTTTEVSAINGEMQKLTTGSVDLLNKINRGSADAQKQIMDLTNEIQVLQAPPEMRELIKQRQELIALSAAGADPAELSRLHALLNEHRELTKLQKESETLAGKMNSKLASLKSPFEVWKDEIEDIKKALAQGIITEEQAKKLTDAATVERDEAEKQTRKPGESSSSSGGGPVAAKVGTVEAYKLITSAGTTQEETSRQYAIAQKQLKATEKANELLAKVVKKPTEQAVVEEVNY